MIGVGVGRAEHHAHAGAGDDDPDDLIRKLKVRHLRGPDAESDGGDGAAQDHGPLGPLAVEDAPADLRRDGKAEEEVEQEEPGLRRRLAQ